MENRELGKIDFELIDDAFKALLKSQPDPMTVCDAFTGWLEFEGAAYDADG